MVEAHRIPTNPRFQNLTGKTFDRVKVIRYMGRNKNKHATWECRCECGTVWVTETSSLTTRHTRSCGCLHVDTTREKNLSHGHSRVGKKTPEYNSWRAMKSRCYDPKNCHFQNYGGRGVTVCERWLTFANFLSDMGLMPTPSLTIERKNTNGNYEPENCKWATCSEQSNNKRCCKKITYNGVTLNMTQWEKKLGFKRSVIQGRLRLGWSVERALTTPQ